MGIEYSAAFPQWNLFLLIKCAPCPKQKNRATLIMFQLFSLRCKVVEQRFMSGNVLGSVWKVWESIKFTAVQQEPCGGDGTTIVDDRCLWASELITNMFDLCVIATERCTLYVFGWSQYTQMSLSHLGESSFTTIYATRFHRTIAACSQLSTNGEGDHVCAEVELEAVSLDCI